MDLILRDLHLPLRHPFTISQGTTLVQHNLLVELRDKGQSGYGEAASSHAYSAFTAPRVRRDLESVRGEIERTNFADPVTFWDDMVQVLGGDRFALCALDQAAHDLWGKKLGAPVWKLLGLELRDLPRSNYTIGIDTIDKMIAKMREFEGWPIYKIKLGTPDDIAIVRALREHTDAIFRVDANCAWDVEKTLSLAPKLKELGVEFIEQPLPVEQVDPMREVYAKCPLPVIADESCLVEEDVARCAGLFHGINIKLTKAGGMTPARRMIKQARELGLKVMIGCMTESSVGISAIGQLLPLLDYVDMDGALLIVRDIATGVRVEKGQAIFPEANGNGVHLVREV